MLRAMLDFFSAIYAGIRAWGRALSDLGARLVKTCSGRAQSSDKINTDVESVDGNHAQQEPGPKQAPIINEHSGSIAPDTLRPAPHLSGMPKKILTAPLPIAVEIHTAPSEAVRDVTAKQAHTADEEIDIAASSRRRSNASTIPTAAEASDVSSAAVLGTAIPQYKACAIQIVDAPYGQDAIAVCTNPDTPYEYVTTSFDGGIGEYSSSILPDTPPSPKSSLSSTLKMIPAITASPIAQDLSTAISAEPAIAPNQQAHVDGADKKTDIAVASNMPMMTTAAAETFITSAVASPYKLSIQRVNTPDEQDEIAVCTNPDTPYEYVTTSFDGGNIQEEKHGYFRRMVSSIKEEWEIIADNTAILKRTMAPTISIEQIRKDKPTWEAHLSTKEQYKSLRRPIIDSAQTFGNSKDIAQKLKLYNEYQLHKNSIAPEEPGARNNAGDAFVEKQLGLYESDLNRSIIKYDLEPNARFTVPSKPITEGSDKRTPYKLRSATYQRQEFVYKKHFLDGTIRKHYYPFVLVINAESAGFFSGYARHIISSEKIFSQDFSWRSVRVCNKNPQDASGDVGDKLYKTHENPESILREQALCCAENRGDGRNYNDILLEYSIQDVEGLEIEVEQLLLTYTFINRHIIALQTIYAEKARLGCAVPTKLVIVGPGERIHSLTPEATQRLINLDDESLGIELSTIHKTIVEKHSDKEEVGYGSGKKLWVPDPVLNDSAAATSATAAHQQSA